MLHECCMLPFHKASPPSAGMLRTFKVVCILLDFKEIVFHIGVGAFITRKKSTVIDPDKI